MQVVARVVAIAAVPLADVECDGSDAVELAAEQLAGREVLSFSTDVLEGRLASREGGVGPGERLFAGRIHLEGIHAPDEVVPGRARHRPAAQGFCRLEDLLHHDPRVGSSLIEPPQVLGRIAQAVRMVHAQTRHEPVPDQRQHQAVVLPEDLLVLDADSDQRRDVEEAPVAEVALGGAPPGEAVVLPADQQVETVHVRIDLADHSVNHFTNSGFLFHQPLQKALEHLLVSMAHPDAGAIVGG